MEQDNLWVELGALFRDFRKRNDFTQEYVAVSLGLAKSRISEIENARSRKKGLNDQLVEKLIVLLKIPAAYYEPIFQKHGVPFLRPSGEMDVRKVYISAFDVDSDLKKLNEEQCFGRIFTYVLFADEVSFQFSDPLKNEQLCRAMLHFDECFMMNERWQAKPLIQLFSNGKTDSFTDYLSQRRSFLKNDTANLEAESYDSAVAEEVAPVLDRFAANFTLKTRRNGVTEDIVGRLKRYFVGSKEISKANPAYDLAYRIWNEPNRFQTFRFKKSVADKIPHPSKEVQYFTTVIMRQNYHEANAVSVCGVVDTVAIWKFENLNFFLNLVGISARSVFSMRMDGQVSLTVFTIRKNRWFNTLCAMYFDCVSPLQIAAFLTKLEEISQGCEQDDWQRRLDEMGPKMFVWASQRAI